MKATFITIAVIVILVIVGNPVLMYAIKAAGLMTGTTFGG